MGIPKSELKTAIKFLKERTIDVRKNKNLSVYCEVLSLYEVLGILNLLKKKKFKKFYQEQKEFKEMLYREANLKK